MRRLLLCLLLLLPAGLAAQTDDSDRGFVQGLLEDALSGPGREVRIVGFAGALSSRATIEEITVSDRNGIWLSLRDVAMVWTRSALLRGEIEIDEISVGLVQLPRPPLPAEGELPEPEARGSFSLPDLPVAVRIAQMQIARVELGAPVLGEAAAITVGGSAALASGAGTAQLSVERLDAGGQLSLSGSFDNASTDLTLELRVTEPEGGIAVSLLDMPGRPSLDLAITGSGPLDDFATDIRLATDGAERLSGQITLRGEVDGASRFAVDLGGDVAPVFAPEYRAFLGPEIELTAQGAQQADGTLTLDSLDLSAAALRLEGAAEIAPDGWPRRLALDGSITPPAGDDRVLLPLPGARTSVESVRLSGAFDAASGETWQIEGRAVGVKRDGAGADMLGFSGTGEIARDTGRVTGRLDLDAAGLDPGDAALATAIGDTLRGALNFDWTRGAPLSLTDLALAGADYGVTGAITLSGLDGDADLTVAPDLELATRDLSRFGPIAGLDLAGAATLAISGAAEPLTGVIDLTLSGTTRDIATGIAQVDPLLEGQGRLSLAAVRDETGLRVDPFEVRTEAARIEGMARVSTGDSDVFLEAAIAEIARILPELDGPATLTIEAAQRGNVWQIGADTALPGDARLEFTGNVSGDGENELAAAGRLEGRIGRLAAFSGLAGRDVSGRVILDAEGTADLLAGSFDVAVTGETAALAFDVPMVEPLFRGSTRFDLAAGRDADGAIEIVKIDLSGPGLTASGSGRIAAGDSELQLSAGLPEIELILQQLPGAAQLTATASQTGETWQIDALAQLPGDAQVSYAGSVTGDGQSALEVAGRLEAEISQLAAYADLAGRRLSGAITLAAQGAADIVAATFDVTAAGETRSLAFDQPTIEPLLRGTTTFNLVAARGGDGVLRIDDLSLDGPALEVDASGRLSDSAAALDYRAAVSNLGVVVAELPGPASVSGTARHEGGPWQIDATGSGPGGISLATSGRVAQDISRVDLSLNGSAPLALANAQLRGQAVSGLLRFDLSVNGPPALNSVSGRLGLENARFALPAQGLALTDIGGQVSLDSGRAQVGINGNLSSGGRLDVSGPVSLSPPFTADLTATLAGATVRDRELFEAQLGARITVGGPLTGGARIGGTIALDTVEVRIPSVGVSYASLDGLRHVAPPSDVRRTLQYSGLAGAETPGSGASGPAFPLDLTITAPSRLFVRGRGLDAELGGQLRLTGTTNDVVPIGQFDLIRGRLNLLGNRLTLDEGAVRLRGSFDPVIRFVATSEVDGTDVILRLEGLASEPELTITSNPELPQDEALSLLLFGRDATSISPLQAVELAAAIRTLSGRGGLGLSGQLREGLGVDDFDIGTDAEGNAEARIGKYLSETIYTDVTVNSDGESQINLNLDVSKNVTVRGRVGSDGDTGIGVFYERDY